MSPKAFYYSVGPRKFFEFIIFTVFLLFFYTPILNNLMIAFGNIYRYPNVFPQEWGFHWWEFVLGQEELLESVFNSFIIAVFTTIVSLIICLPAAYALARYKFKGKNFIMFSFLLTNAFPKMGLYVAIGIIFYKFNMVGTYLGVLIIHVMNTLMFMVWLPAGSFSNVQKQQEEAARDCGAKPFRVFTQITIPQAMPGIIVASIYTFLGSLEESQGTLLIGFPEIKTMATSMYGVILEYPAQAAAVFSAILLIPSIIVIIIFRRYISAEGLSSGMNVK